MENEVHSYFYMDKCLVNRIWSVLLSMTFLLICTTNVLNMYIIKYFYAYILSSYKNLHYRKHFDLLACYWDHIQPYHIKIDFINEYTSMKCIERVVCVACIVCVQLHTYAYTYRYVFMYINIHIYVYIYT
jgi:hypothetical protein